MYRPFVRLLGVEILSKRIVSSSIARLYDPLGWLSPVILVAKLFMKKLWKTNLDWDDPLPQALDDEWSSFYGTLLPLDELSIPRWTGHGSDAKQCELHGFADASNSAYAAVVYLCLVTYDGCVTVTLLMSKTRVAPGGDPERLSIPRLELCAAVLLAELMTAIRALPEYSRCPVYLWSDASVVLAWLRQQSSRWKTFVGNRVAVIHQLFPEISWKHVVSGDNPADFASRGLTAQDLVDCRIWWHGPPWLSSPEADWPASAPESPAEDILEVQAVVLSAVGEDSYVLSYALKVSSWVKLQRVISLVLRWLPTQRPSRRNVPISGPEMFEASIRIVKHLQEIQFPHELASLRNSRDLEKSSPLLSLHPFLGTGGLLRVGGRLGRSDLEYDAKFPAILRAHHIIRLIVEYAHGKSLHGGVTLTLATLRSRFWVLHAGKVVRSVIHQCVPCARIKSAVGQQLMGELPAPRVTRPARPFEHSGLDYAGPIPVRRAGGRGVRAMPAYVAVFVCMATKAVHLEVVSDYSSETFLAAFRRFCARRGLPKHIYSDRGTNFVGADRELRQAFRNAISDSRFQAILAEDAITWHFNPPAAPHFGGLWEAAVKSMKSHMKRVLQAHTPTFEELGTLTAQIEACLNSRPLSPLRDSPDSLEVLTPAHFLVGGPIVAIPQKSLVDSGKSRLTRWQAYSEMLERFWRLWMTDCVQSLQHRSNWRYECALVSVGQMVLLRNDCLPPTKWALGRVTEVHPGKDGLTRVVTVRTATSSFVRPIAKLAMLPLTHDDAAPSAAAPPVPRSPSHLAPTSDCDP